MTANAKHPAIRALVWLLLVVMAAGSFAGCSSAAPQATTAPVAAETSATAAPTEAPTPAPDPNALPFAEAQEFTMLYNDVGYAPLKDDWLVLQELKKRANVTLKLEVVPGSDWDSKLQVLYQSNELPDIVPQQWPGSWDNQKEKIFLPISDHMDKLPNYKMMIEKWGMQEAVKLYSDKDGKLYYFLSFAEKPIYTSGLIMRADLLKKYGMEVKTFDDLVAFCRKYKEENPDSVPITDTYGFDCMLSFIDNAFGVQAGWSGWGSMYYDYTQKKFRHAALSEEYKNYIAFLAGLVKEGLMDPEIATQTEDQFKSKLATGKSIVTWFYSEPVAGLNKDGKTNVGGDFELKLYPPLAGPGGAKSNYMTVSKGPGWCIPVTSSTKPYFDKLLTFCDWVGYSEEGIALTTWGVQDVTYTIADGKFAFTDEVLNSPDGASRTLQAKFGLNMSNFNLSRGTDFLLACIDESMRETAQSVIDNGMLLDPIPVTDIPSEVWDAGLSAKVDNISAFMNPIIADILLGKKTVEADWAAMVEEAKAKGAQEVEDAWNQYVRK